MLALRGLKTKEYYEKVINYQVKQYNYIKKEDELVNLISEEHRPILQSMTKDLDTIHPSEVLISTGYLTEEQYIDIMNETFNGKLLNIYPVIGKSIRPFNLNDYDLSKAGLDKDTVVNFLQKLYNNGIVPIGELVEGSVFCWGYCEPNNTKLDQTENDIVYLDKKNENGVTVSSLTTKVFGALNLNLILVTKPTFNKITRDMVKNNKLMFNNQTDAVIPVRYFVDKIIASAISDNATDIKIWGVPEGLKSSVSILKSNYRSPLIPMTRAQLEEAKAYLYSLCTKDSSSFKIEQERNYEIDDLGLLNKKYRGRVNILPSTYMDSFCIRVLKTGEKLWRFPELLLHQHIKDRIKSVVINNKYGLIVISGETGSGKSTTIRAILIELEENWRPDDSIESIELPIEEFIDNISQVSISTDKQSEMKVEDIIRAETRRASSIVNVNEINNQELLRGAINLGQMKHLVLTSIHTYSVPSIPDRVVSMIKDDPNAYRQFIQLTRCMIQQSMLKQCCPECTHDVLAKDCAQVTTDMISVLKNLYGWNVDKDPIKITTPNKDCPICKGRGIIYKNPVVCIEMLELTNKVQDLLLHTSLEDVQRVIRRELVKANSTGVQDALLYMKEGKVDFIQIWKEFGMINQVGDWLSKEGEQSGSL